MSRPAQPSTSRYIAARPILLTQVTRTCTTATTRVTVRLYPLIARDSAKLALVAGVIDYLAFNCQASTPGGPFFGGSCHFYNNAAIGKSYLF